MLGPASQQGIEWVCDRQRAGREGSARQELTPVKSRSLRHRVIPPALESDGTMLRLDDCDDNSL
jgi:hypothetical protein